MASDRAPATTAHTLHAHQHHQGWNNALPPVLRIAPGETVTIDTVDSSGGQLGPGATIETLRALDFGRINPVTGPIFIDGAEPGDALRIRIDHFAPSGWGWTANIPGFGLLAADFPDPALHLWQYDPTTLAPAAYGEMARVPLKPFCGTIGLAPAAPGLHSIVPPRRVGGNLDLRDLSAGAELILPVEVAGGLFSVGDTHAAQGDGEVCGTAIESPMQLTLTFDLVKHAAPRFPQAILPGPVTRHLDGAGYEVTTGIGPDLMENAKAALSDMIDRLCRSRGMSAIDAYMLCSVCGDLRISSIVDAPNWLVSFYLPRIVFE